MNDYDCDILAWSERQSGLLRRVAAGEGVNDQIDWLNIAEEVEALGKSEKRELRSRIATILLHLIKLQASPAIEPRLGWRETVREQRDGIQILLEDSPSLGQFVAEMIAQSLNAARRKAEASLGDRAEEPKVDLAGLDYTEDQVLGSWLP